MKKALIDTQINEVTDVQPEAYDVSGFPSFIWVDCPDNQLIGWKYVEGSFIDPNARSLAQCKEDALSSLAAFRYTQETKGIVFNGVEIATDRSSQSVLASARTIAKEKKANNLWYEIDWKGKNGWFKINSDQIIAIADRVAAHVQNCFSEEKRFGLIIQGLSSLQEVNAYDFETQWKNL